MSVDSLFIPGLFLWFYWGLPLAVEFHPTLYSCSGSQVPSFFSQMLVSVYGGATYPFKDASFPPPAATLTEILLGEVSHHPMDRS